jgi:hypothetical protein
LIARVDSVNFICLSLFVLERIVERQHRAADVFLVAWPGFFQDFVVSIVLLFHLLQILVFFYGAADYFENDLCLRFCQVVFDILVD